MQIFQGHTNTYSPSKDQLRMVAGDCGEFKGLVHKDLRIFINLNHCVNKIKFITILEKMGSRDLGFKNNFLCR